MVVSHMVREIKAAIDNMKGSSVTVNPAQGKLAVEFNGKPVGGSFGGWH
ncbi:unnamed protein product, partial [marine sediment metagenome]